MLLRDYSRLTGKTNTVFQMFEALCFEGKEVSDKKKREQFKKLVAGIVGVRMDRSASVIYD